MAAPMARRPSCPVALTGPRTATAWAA